MNQRKKALIIFAITVGFLTFVTVFGIVVTDGARVTDFSKKNMAPCLSYLFGTDWLGRDMLLRTFAGLSMSIRIGLLAAGFSAIIAFVLGVSAAVFGGKADAVISFVIDMIMGIPHILLLLLISYALGKGVKGGRSGTQPLAVPCKSYPCGSVTVKKQHLYTGCGKIRTQ